MSKKESIERNESDFVDLVKKTELFPAVCEAMIILLTLPATICTVERSFSKLRPVKTWLRSDRLSELCMMRARINTDQNMSIEKISEKFG
ncbi:hypothetical protein DPMN_153103 [Dreissena polymorpha]|uniref:HAT C-terminal dimerisation domain-containing protein n=1 Tax=Dreissena polymorpha TaxID=45954 RepID=A0A9D4FII7_DREPO|nr:hypothetical protein DPMN_153103 [Dreissena polymorpha]